MVNKTRSVPMVFRRNHWANIITAHRTELGMTQDAVGSLVGLTGTAISVYEAGKEDSPKIKHFLAICNLFDLDPREFFELGDM